MLKQLKKAAQATGLHQVALAGGVAANSGLRQGLQALAAAEATPYSSPTSSFAPTTRQWWARRPSSSTKPATSPASSPAPTRG
ncbi:MAG: hypothetical protein WKG07_09885 [Hymenobacter sp.]